MQKSDIRFYFALRSPFMINMIQNDGKQNLVFFNFET